MISASLGKALAVPGSAVREWGWGSGEEWRTGAQEQFWATLISVNLGYVLLM